MLPGCPLCLGDGLLLPEPGHPLQPTGSARLLCKASGGQGPSSWARRVGLRLREARRLTQSLEARRQRGRSCNCSFSPLSPTGALSLSDGLPFPVSTNQAQPLRTLLPSRSEGRAQDPWPPLSPWTFSANLRKPWAPDTPPPQLLVLGHGEPREPAEPGASCQRVSF